MADGVIRHKPGFTAVQNTVARDENLSLRAKGLFLVIQADITIPNKVCKKSDFFNKACEGEKAFESAWNDLKEAGYLKTHVYTRDGKFVNEYELLDEAVPGPHTFYYDKTGKVTRTNLDLVGQRAAQAEKQREYWKEIKKQQEEAKKEEPDESDRTPEKGVTDRSYQNGTYANGTNGNSTNGDGGNNNKTIPKTENKTDNPIHHHQEEQNSKAEVADDDGSEKCNVLPLEEQIKKNIEYDRLCMEHPENVKLFDYIVKIMSEMLTAFGPRVYISRNHYENVESVRKNIGSLRYDDIVSLVEQLPDRTERKISDPASFMKTCLFNARERMNAVCYTNKKDERRNGHQYDFKALMDFINA